MGIYRSATDLIGRTPLLELVHIEKSFSLKARILAKLEYLNPTGSAKDRAARYMIEDAERRGKLKEGGVIIEPTSGNTGIALSSIAAQRGYRTIIVMPESMSEERRRLMLGYGAELVLTPASEGMGGSIRKASELASEIPGSFIPDQFSNHANARAHEETTGPEIFADTEGHVDFLVAGVGTGGTVTGTGRYLKSRIPSLSVIAVEPLSSPVLSSGRSGRHGIQGIGAGFVPDVFDSSIIDEIIAVSDDDSYNMGRLICRKEGVSVGISSGAVLSAAVEIARRSENEGKTIVVIFPDSGDRYLSTPLFPRSEEQQGDDSSDDA